MKISFSPSVYEHAAALLGMTPWEVSRDAELIRKAHSKAYQIYQHTPIVVGIDIYNIEAEAYGCRVERPAGNGIPAIIKGIFDSIKETQALNPFNPKTDGRIMAIIEAGKKIASDFPKADVKVPVSGPFSIAVSLRGMTGILEDIAYYPEEVFNFLMALVDNQIEFCKAVIGEGLDIAFFESAASPPLLSPRLFKEVELPALKKAMKGVEDVVMHPIPCIIGGDTEPILEDILSTGTGYIICPASTETNQVKFMQKLHQQSDVKVRINMNPKIVASGSKADIIDEVDRILDLAAGKQNVLLGTGAVPYETPIENILFIKNYVND